MSGVINFEYSADLVDSETHRSFSGTASYSDWEKNFIKTPEQSAWAFVRSLLRQEGKWHCTIIMDDRAHRHKIIDVEMCEGAILRIDRDPR